MSNLYKNTHRLEHLRQKLLLVTLLIISAIILPGVRLYGKPLFLNCFNAKNLANLPIRIQGTVKTDQGETLPGVSVSIKGRAGGTVTGANGKFSLLVNSGDVIVVSYIGYGTQEITIKGQTEYSITMKLTHSDLNEVVVLGYGTVKKSDLTGSVSTIKLEDVNEDRIISVPEALQGKLAGVQILNNTGEPGSGMTFNIRGRTSISGSNQPLIVIDGQPIESSLGAATAGIGLADGEVTPPSDPLAALNPADIASIEVLKDASSTAIYGSRGSNGVVLITTKSGKAGKDRVTYTSRLDRSSLPKQLKLLHSDQYMQYINEAYINSGKAALYTQQQIDSISQAIDVNWQDAIYRTAFSQDHQLAISGKDEKSNYYLTGNYTDQNNLLLGKSYKRGGVRLNYERNVNSKLTVSFKNYLSYATRNYGQQSASNGITGSSTVLAALTFNPINSPVTSDGDDDETIANNPLTVLSKAIDNTHIRTIISNFSIDYKITPNLSYQLRAGLNDLYSLRQTFWPKTTFIGTQANFRSASRADNGTTNYLLDNLLTYNYSTKHSTINAVGGFSYQVTNNKAASQTNTQFPSDAFSYNIMASAAGQGILTTIDKTSKLSSVLGRVNYAYDSKYLLTFTARYDGSSRLAPGHNWQLFPSIGLGWNVSNEQFFKNKFKAISMLKLRGSYGISGNQNVAVGASEATYALAYGALGTSGSTPGYILNSFANPNLRWEKTAQYNAGIDLGLMDDRLTLSVDLYKKTTSDLLVQLTLPGSAGFNNYYPSGSTISNGYAANIGSIENKGIDIQGDYAILRGKIRWDVGANFSIYRNKVLDLGTLSLIGGRQYISSGSIALNQYLQVAKVGYSIPSFWGYKTAGIYQTQDEINNDPALKNDATKSSIGPGDVKFVDLNGDGQITDADKTIIGKPNPDFTYGFNTSLSYKRFSFSMSILGSYGNQLINLNDWVIAANNPSSFNQNELQSAYDGRWTGPGTSNLYPRPLAAAVRLNQRFPDWMVEDASFVRLQNVNIGYTFNIKTYKIKTYLSGTNLLTITKYTGYDPSVNPIGDVPLGSGIDFGTLPQSRTFSLGLQLTF